MQQWKHADRFFDISGLESETESPLSLQEDIIYAPVAVHEHFGLLLLIFPAKAVTVLVHYGIMV